MKARLLLRFGWGVAAGLIFSGWPGVDLAASPAWRYRLLEGSMLANECLICARPTIPLPMRGTFDLELTGQNPLRDEYTLKNVRWTTTAWPDSGYNVTGDGLLGLGGEVAIQQDMTLRVVIKRTDNTIDKVFTNEVRTLSQLWPVMEIDLVQTDVNLVEFYRIHLLAAPLQDLWFSTTAGLTAGLWQTISNHISGSDLLSLDGRIVKRKEALFDRLGILPAGVPDLGLDAVDMSASGEVFFSINEDVFSETLGPIHPGDLLSSQGRIVKANQELTKEFAIMPPVPDLGLDAISIQPAGEIWFSIVTQAFSEKMGPLGKGDILSSAGKVVKSNRQLLARFQPEKADYDYGLDALYVWPSGEIWFSTEEGFNDKALGVVTAGTLLSDRGYIVYRNLELVGAFRPLEDLSDFGLDALHIITDVTPPPPPAQIFEAQASPPDFVLRWAGKGGAYQVEHAEAIGGPFTPASSILLDPVFEHQGALKEFPNGYYRVRSW